MWSLWIFVCGFIIFWSLEIRYNELAGRIRTLEIILKELEDHFSDLRRELEKGGLVKEIK